MIQRQKAIRAARKDFWIYNKLESPKFYKETRWHLRLMSEVLQALYQRRLTKAWFIAACKRICPKWFIKTDDFKEMTSRLVDGHIYERMIMNEPPRIGKSRTLVNFCKWALGDNVENRIMTCSYNDTTAQDFSRYTRDGIMATKTYPHETIYNDVFPNTVVQDGNASYKQWALEGQFFNYKGAGVGGSITGKGANILIVDDPIKGAEEALNEDHLEKVWTWYSGTFLSRLETEEGVGKNAIQIVNMTRWASGDICGRILGDEKNPGPEAHEWFVFKLQARYENGEMLCPELLSEKQYLSLKKNVLPSIHAANYHQQPIDEQGRLYKYIKTYTKLPQDEQGRLLFDRIIAYTDTADEGEDYLCSIVGGVFDGQVYVLDIYYTKDGMEITEGATAKMMLDNEVGYSLIESNNGGRGFARAVDRIGWETYQNRHTVIKWFHQTQNKRSRIQVNAASVMNNVYFPINWRDRFPDFYEAITKYQKEGKNKNDDAPDALTGIYEMINKKSIFVGALDIRI
jgi:predicted phage terminase large subunit-like protein